MQACRSWAAGAGPRVAGRVAGGFRERGAARPAARAERRHAAARSPGAAGTRKACARGRSGGRHCRSRARVTQRTTCTAQRRRLVRSAGVAAVCLPARGLAAHCRGPLGTAACNHRQRQDLRGVVRPAQPLGAWLWRSELEGAARLRRAVAVDCPSPCHDARERALARADSPNPTSSWSTSGARSSPACCSSQAPVRLGRARRRRSRECLRARGEGWPVKCAPASATLEIPSTARSCWRARQSRRRSTRCCRTSPAAFPGAATSAPDARAGGARDRGRGTTLVFTNTRSQAEIWYQLLLQARPAVGRRDRAAPRLARQGGARVGRGRPEGGPAEGGGGDLVSLDLGVDFLPVERVLQIGSAKGVARLLQRAGRSGHAPGRVSRVTLVPTHTLELVEAAAARTAARPGPRRAARAPDKPLDVLVQHLVTVALGTGFAADEAAGRGAQHRAATAPSPTPSSTGRWTSSAAAASRCRLPRVPPHRARRRCLARARPGIARRHRMSVGTIVADASMQVKLCSTAPPGHDRGELHRRLRKGDCFVFAGRVLELVRVHEMTAYVQPAKRRSGAVPRWAGGKMPLSSEMADACWRCSKARRRALRRAGAAARGRCSNCRRAGRRCRRATRCWSSRCGRARAGTSSSTRLPGRTRISAWRRCSPGGRQGAPSTFSIAVNDYGFELLSPVDID
jgi:hypothetical protein